VDLSGVTVIIGTYGTKLWFDKGAPAAESARAAGFDQVVRYHGGCSPSDARNSAAFAVDHPCWLLFVDADDQLDPGFGAVLDDMHQADAYELLVPKITYADRNGGHSEPVHYRDRNIQVMNPCPIGTLIRVELFRRVGGFWNEPAWEDWSLFRRAWLVGAQLNFIDAVYHAGYSPRGRNSTVRQPRQLLRQIRESHDLWIEATS
jgi:hypothetical protein